MLFGRILLILAIFSVYLSANIYKLKIDKDFIKELVEKYRFDEDYLNDIFSQVNIQKRALEIYLPKPKKKSKKSAKSAKKIYYWPKYKKIFITPAKIRKGALFVKRHKKILKKAYEKYGVDPYYIAAIIGIESHYGANTGKYRVIDTLSTLSFIPNRRSKFFKKELKEFLVFTQKTSFDPLKIKGSYAGAIGLGQFMPSAIKHFSVDFNNDGVLDPWNSEDMIGSIARYLKENGWQKDKKVAMRVRYRGKRFKKLKTGYKTRYRINGLKRYGIYLPKNAYGKEKVSLIKLENEKFDELWIGFKNFYVITRYNHSAFYAMAVHLLAQKIKKFSR